MPILAEYHCGREGGHLFLIRADRDEPIVLMFSLEAVYEELVGFLQGVMQPSAPDVEAGPGLRSLVEPIVRHAAEDEQVWIVPHGLLHFLPFHAVYTDEGYLGFRNPVCYTPSASTLRVCRRGPRLNGKPTMVLGDPTEDLKYARREANAVGEAFGVTPLLGSSATRGKFLSALAEHPQFDLVHFACHGEPGSVHLAPDRSLGAEGAELLTADDILRRRVEAALVTVSACDAGLAELEASDEMLGLTRALLYSGAASVLLSTWPVDDFSTYLFVDRCYEELRRMVGENQGHKSLAVRIAQQFVHGLTLSDVVELCDREGKRCRTHGDINGDVDFCREGAEYAARAGDLEEACRRYADLLERLAGLRSDTQEREERIKARLEELEFRTVLKREPVDYDKRPFASVSHWGSFYLHGDWRL